MSIKTKLLLTLLLVSVIPFSAMAAFMFVFERDRMEEEAEEKLRIIAEEQSRRVEDILSGSEEAVRLVASRTQMRISFQEYLQTGDPSALLNVVRIVEAAIQSSSILNSVTFFDSAGFLIHSTRDRPSTQIDPSGIPMHHDIHFVKHHQREQGVFMEFIAPLMLEEEMIGYISVETNAEKLFSLVEDASNLGKTGESLIVFQDGNDAAMTFLGSRHSGGESTLRFAPAFEFAIPKVHAAEEENIIIDYLGAPVFAQSTDFPDHQLTLIVKQDIEEALAPAARFLNSLLLTFIFIAVAIVFIQYVLSRSITRPIRSLSGVMHRMQSGDLSARAEIHSRDEIGQFAKQFNTMADELQDLYFSLEKKVKERTKALRSAKSRDDAILRSIADGLVFTDTEGRVLLINNAAKSLTGYSDEEVIGKNWVSIAGICAENGKKSAFRKTALGEALSQKVVSAPRIISQSYYYTKKDGSIFPVSASAAPVVQDGKLVGAIVVFRDISLQKHIDEQKSEFVSLASHQLRTPLTTMRLFTELILTDKENTCSPQQKEHLYYLQAGVTRMSRLINDLLNVSRIETGRLRIQPKPTNIIAFVKGILKDVDLIAGKKGVTFALSAPKKDFQVPIDPDLLYQAINNLLTNAIRYNGKSKKPVEVSIAKQKDGRVEISVKDSGIGIPKKDQEHLFEKFYRADNARKAEAEGSGLGLYLSRAILVESGGQISFVSAKGKGTTFTITLPPEGMKPKKGEKSLSHE